MFNVLYSRDHLLFERQDTYSLRGICMFFIILHHLYHYLAVDYGFLCHNSLFNYFINSVGYWATGCFFLLSGYGLNSSLKTKKLNGSYVFKHILNLLLPYLYALVLSFILSGDLSMLSKGWFYKTILVVYLLSFAVYYFTKNQWIRFALIIILTTIYIIIAKFHLDLPSYYTNSIICYPIGVLFSTCLPLLQRKRVIPTISVILTFGFFVIISKFNILGGGRGIYISSAVFNNRCLSYFNDQYYLQNV